MPAAISSSTLQGTDPVADDRHTSGGMVALEELCRDYFPKLVAMCREWAGEDAEDVAQEAIVKAMANIERFDASRSIWPWVKVIARHLAADKARRNGREVSVEGVHLHESPPSPGLGVEERMLLNDALQALPERQRAAVALHYLQDRSSAEVAGLLDLTPLALRQLLFRARRRLHTEYRRLAGSVPAVLLMPAGWVRKRVVAIRDRVASILAPRASRPDGWLSPVATQALTGVVAVALIWTGDGGAFRPASGSEHSSSPVVVTGISNEKKDKVGSGNGGRRAAHDGDGAGVAPDQDSVGHAVDRVNESVEDITDPHRGVKQPEDARITSVAFSSGFEEDGTVYAAGYAACRTNVCPHVLFRSADRGATWERLPADGYFGETLILPPGYGEVDRRIFAMGPAGLQVSEDDGKSFRTAAVAGPPNATGSATVSPGFHAGDPTILIGAQTLMRYRDDLRTIETVASTAMPGPLEPAYASSHAGDGRLVVGGLGVDPLSAKAVATVFSCSGAVCLSHRVGDVSGIPKIRVDRYAPATGIVYAFTQRGLYGSRDAGLSFETLSVPHPHGLLWDVHAAADPGRLFAAVVADPAQRGAAGLWTSEDGGGTWQRERDPSFSSGATVLSSEGKWIIVGLADSGIACSSDGGRSWGTRCGGGLA